MGANPYCYFTPYEENFHAALQRLRLREFEAGRYDPALRAANPPTYTFQQSFPPDETFPSPGAQHRSIDAAIEAASESGTGSILDIFDVSTQPAFGSATLMTGDVLQSAVGVSAPTRDDVTQLILNRAEIRTRDPSSLQRMFAFWESIGRGEARLIVVHQDGAPPELFFAGMSVD